LGGESERIGFDENEAEGKDRQFVTALARGLEVLRAFREGDSLLGNREIAIRTGLPKPTISRLTHTLTTLGYLDYIERFGKYRLGTGVLSLGYAALSGMDIRQVARPLMQELADHTDASVSLGSRDRTSMMYIENCRGGGTLTLRLDVGSRIPIATTAMGRAFLAAISEAERGYLMDHLAKHHQDDWPAVKKGIDEAIHDYARRGFTLSVGEWQKDVHAVGVAVVSPESGMVMALNCGGAAFLMPRDKLVGDYGPRLVQVARNIEAALARR
jgi:DNA-binding IclR family transcriptional regulator